MEMNRTSLALAALLMAGGAVFATGVARLSAMVLGEPGKVANLPARGAWRRHAAQAAALAASLVLGIAVGDLGEGSGPATFAAGPGGTILSAALVEARPQGRRRLSPGGRRRAAEAGRRQHRKSDRRRPVGRFARGRRAARWLAIDVVA